MEQTHYKSNAELKYLARTQMGGRFGLLIGTMLIPLLISFFCSSFLLSNNYLVNFVISIILQTLLSVLQVGATLIYMKSACNMPAQIGDLFDGFRNNLQVALKVGLLFTFINTVCMIPCDVMSIRILNSPALAVPEITETTTLNEMMQFYNVFYSVMGAYYLLMLACVLVSFLLQLVFVPAYYIILDFPEWDAMKVLKKSIEVMRGNKLRYVLLQISFLPALLLSVFTCGLTLIWVMPYMHMTNTNFYLDIMAVKNKNMNNSSY
jgi:uncharacterized membrane protein